jgi:AcrR family transcriptional regulator
VPFYLLQGLAFNMDANTDSQEVENSSRRQNTRVRQEQIITAALELISRDGVDSLSVAAVARAVGIVPSALYRHFSGKEEILQGVNATICADLVKNVRMVEEITPDPLHRLELLVKRHIRLVQSKPGIARYVFSTGILPRGTERKVRLFKGVCAYLHEIERIMATAQEQGQIATQHSASDLSYMFLGLIQPAVFLHQLGDGDYDMETRIETGWRIFKHMIGHHI